MSPEHGPVEGAWSVITGSLLRLLFDAASMQRWNDHIRPAQGFTELDKQAHKMVYAYVLAKFEECENHARVNWLALIEGGLCEFLQRIKLTDIKPPIYHKLMAEQGAKLNRWVWGELRDVLRDVAPDFPQVFRSYFDINPETPGAGPDGPLPHEDDASEGRSSCVDARGRHDPVNSGDPGDSDPEAVWRWTLERKILRAAHYLATNWEFRIVYNLNRTLYGLEDTREEVESQLEDHANLLGVQKLALGKKTSHFMDLVGQLRFQQRWAQTPRIPSTSVLGHMLIVAILSYVCAKHVGACPRRVCNDFFGGLFHDLPEVLTRDIVSPVKKSVEGLDDVIKEIEKRQMEERILPLLPAEWHREIRYYVENEFANKILQGGTPRMLEGDIDDEHNKDELFPMDGRLIRACDELAAYMEALLSVEHGIRSRQLDEGTRTIEENWRGKVILGIDFETLLDEVSRMR